MWIVLVLDEVTDNAQLVSTSHRTLDSVYREVLEEDRLATAKLNKTQEKFKEHPETEHSQTHEEKTGRSDEPESSQEERSDQLYEPESRQEEQSDRLDEPRGREGQNVKEIHLQQSISSLRAGSNAPVTVRGDVELMSDEEISSNRESNDTIRSIPRFRNYEPGKPSKVRHQWKFIFSITEKDVRPTQSFI